MTPTEMVEAWDRGETIHSIKMGGLGPEVEKVIQVLMIEIVRVWRPLIVLLPKGFPTKEQFEGVRIVLNMLRDDHIDELQKLPEFNFLVGLGGSQVEAASKLAGVFAFSEDILEVFNTNNSNPNFDITRYIAINKENPAGTPLIKKEE